MPRTKRDFVENACYHITMRGNRKQMVFQDAHDFSSFIALIHKYKVRYGCKIYGYCLMTNHVHLVLESPRGKLARSKFMQGISQSYAIRFNKKYDKVGHLWQSRFKDFVALKDDYILNLLTYVEYNPVRAGITLKPEDYQWSSYRARMLGEKNKILDKISL